MSFGSEILLKVGVVLAFALNGAVIFTLMDVKASAWMQRRPGPLHVGLRGLIFPLAEVIKFATNFAVMGVLGPVFLSCLAYP